MGSSYDPQRIQTIEKHEQIYYDYIELNQMLRLTNPKTYQEITQTWKYKELAARWYMHYKSIGRIIRSKLKQNATGQAAAIPAGK